MEPGFYGLHIHAMSRCDPSSTSEDKPEKKGDFLSAGGHMGSDDAEHPNHAGDLPSLLVNDDGTGELSSTTDRFTQADLDDDDGSAAMLHSGPDNFANIPERYAPMARTRTPWAQVTLEHGWPAASSSKANTHVCARWMDFTTAGQ